ncbi:hypothetical protein SP8_0034 [Escherichia phage vB_EcoS_SP8]|nr:hypothetical protein SP8_0034 [Escherichia phage vB_EcoS_SP8]
MFHNNNIRDYAVDGVPEIPGSASVLKIPGNSTRRKYQVAHT